jgi:hypothetical protein
VVRAITTHHFGFPREHAFSGGMEAKVFRELREAVEKETLPPA